MSVYECYLFFQVFLTVSSIFTAIHEYVELKRVKVYVIIIQRQIILDAGFIEKYHGAAASIRGRVVNPQRGRIFFI